MHCTITWFIGDITVPQFHRVCRVDALAGNHKRLSIAGWFMTEH
ncbi:MAG: hypothetical protein VST67_03095 [Nitrospirota bacterium]|nr:hypothetical protein [Nitrospirota bacterium]